MNTTYTVIRIDCTNDTETVLHTFGGLDHVAYESAQTACANANMFGSNRGGPLPRFRHEVRKA
jgi:hypothetical protein